jgi:hypothetical protein
MMINYFTFPSKVPIISNEMTDKKQDDPSKIFTYDPDAEASTEAPSLTRLLNRKSLSQKKTTSAQNPETSTKTPPQPPTSPHTPTASAPEKPTSASIELNQLKTPPPISTSTPPLSQPTPSASSPTNPTESKQQTSIAIELADPSSVSTEATQKPSTIPATHSSGSSPSQPESTASTLTDGGIEIAGLESLQLEVESNRPITSSSSENNTSSTTASSNNTPLDRDTHSAPAEFSLEHTNESALSSSQNIQPSSQFGDQKIKAPLIKPASTPFRDATHTELKKWELYELGQSSDPLGKAIIQMLQRGAHCALFMAISSPEKNSSLPIFKTTAATPADSRIPLWSGIKWKPELLPEVWNSFLKSGQIEFGPPSSQSMPTRARNIMRAAFGVSPSEWFIFVRVGSAQSCRGVIAFFSKQSLLSELAHVLPLLNSELPK